MLDRVQVFVVSLFCTVILAASVAIATVPSPGTSVQRFLGPSHDLDPLINFGSVVVSILPLFLAYYHLGPLGVLLSFVVSGILYSITRTYAWLVFGYGWFGHSILREASTYLAFCLMIVLVQGFGHVKASKSQAIQRAQRAMHL